MSQETRQQWLLGAVA